MEEISVRGVRSGLIGIGNLLRQEWRNGRNISLFLFAADGMLWRGS